MVASLVILIGLESLPGAGRFDYDRKGTNLWFWSSKLALIVGLGRKWFVAEVPSWCALSIVTEPLLLASRLRLPSSLCL